MVQTNFSQEPERDKLHTEEPSRLTTLSDRFSSEVCALSPKQLREQIQVDLDESAQLSRLASTLESRSAEQSLKRIKGSIAKNYFESWSGTAVTGLLGGAALGALGYLGSFSIQFWPLSLHSNLLGGAMALFGAFAGSEASHYEDERLPKIIGGAVVLGVAGHFLGEGAQLALQAMNLSGWQAALYGLAGGAALGVPLGFLSRLLLPKKDPDIIATLKEAQSIEKDILAKNENRQVAQAAIAQKVGDLRSLAVKKYEGAQVASELLSALEVRPLVEEGVSALIRKYDTLGHNNAAIYDSVSKLHESLGNKTFSPSSFLSSNPQAPEVVTRLLTPLDHLEDEGHRTEYRLQLAEALRNFLESASRL